MKRLLFLLSFMHLGWAQEIVLKASFTPQEAMVGVMVKAPGPLDVDGDGTPEILMRGNSPYPGATSWYNPVTCQSYFSELGTHLVSYPQGPDDNPVVYFAKMRSAATAEEVQWDLSSQEFLRVFDIGTGAQLLAVRAFNCIAVYDYDQDGYDDLIVGAEGNESLRHVYGIATGNPPIAPPQDLVIQTVGADVVVSWNPVATATAYRILWSSDLDGVSFTRIGYTTETSFIHRNQAGLPQGFYRVMSEDNGTGVGRMVGQSTR